MGREPLRSVRGEDITAALNMRSCSSPKGLGRSGYEPIIAVSGPLCWDACAIASELPSEPLESVLYRRAKVSDLEGFVSKPYGDAKTLKPLPLSMSTAALCRAP